MARRLIHTASYTTRTGAVHTAKVYRDAEYDEWVIRFAAFGVTLQKEDYHTSDKDDAISTAEYHIKLVGKMFA